jgi:hypothetical protein
VSEWSKVSVLKTDIRHTYQGFESLLIRLYGIGHVAQLVEQLAYNEKVSGSSPLELIINAGVVELVDTPGLGSGDYMVLRVQVLPSVRIYGLEEWLSGLRHWFAKSAYTYVYHGFKSHFFRIYV